LHLGFYVGDIIIQIDLGFLVDVIGPWAPTQRGNLLFLSLKKLGEIHIFRALDWLSSIYGSKVMAQTQQII